MKKIILNNCYGGYSWSNPAIYEILTRKGISPKFIAVIYPRPGEGEAIEVPKEEFFRMDAEKPETSYCGPNGEYVADLYMSDKDGNDWDERSIDHEDPVAIAVLEEFGSELCSGSCAELGIEEYDDELFIAAVDDYDGYEGLHLIPRITENRIRTCRNIDEIVDLLRRTNILIKEEEEEK